MDFANGVNHSEITTRFAKLLRNCLNSSIASLTARDRDITKQKEAVTHVKFY